MSSSSSGLIPTEVPHNINTRQFCLLASFREKKQTPFHPSQHVVLLPLVYSPFRPGRESWIWLWDDFGQSWRPWIRIKRRVIPICEKLCWSQNYKLGVFIKLKPFLFWWEECPFFVLFLFSLLEEFLSVLRSLFSSDGRSITPSQIRSSQLMTFSIAGTQAALFGELCFLCLQYGPSRYYTTASASPATNIPTTTAVPATVNPAF